MTTINVSDAAYSRILKRKQKMEETARRVLPIARALDSLLGVNIAEVANKG